jgi:MFS family permease
VLCDKIGMGKLFLLAFLGHAIGIVWTIFATDYLSLFISTLLVGLANGFVESSSYAMLSSIYSNEDKTKKINDWHIWFPGGIVIGGVLAYFLTEAGLSWKIQMLVMLLPTLVYGVMFLNQAFPTSERVKLGVTDGQMFRACLSPLFLLMIFCMLLTAATELATNQWIVELLSSVGVPSILLLVFINGIMTLGRANARYILQRISVTQLLILSALLSFVGLQLLGYVQGYMSFVAAGVFAMGICFFWPTMIGFVSENMPRTGPLGLSLMGGAGLFSTALALPWLGQIYDAQLMMLLPAEYSVEQLKAATDPAQTSLWDTIKWQSGAYTLRWASYLPGVLVIIFTLLHFSRKKVKNEVVTPILEESIKA